MSKEIKKEEVELEETKVEEVKVDEIAELKKELEALRNQMVKQASNLVAETVANMSEVEKHLNEVVPFFAFRDDDKYKDDIIVGINGKNWQIQRGKQVMIPRYVHNAIMDADRQRTEAAMTSSKFADKFAVESNLRKID